jgi:hypothetical protein
MALCCFEESFFAQTAKWKPTRLDLQDKGRYVVCVCVCVYECPQKLPRCDTVFYARHKRCYVMLSRGYLTRTKNTLETVLHVH